MLRMLQTSIVWLPLIAAGCASQQPRPLVLDGRANEWPTQVASIDDPVGDADGPTDVVRLAGRRCGDHVFLHLQIKEPANLHKPPKQGGLRIEVAGSESSTVVDTAERTAERDGQPVPWPDIDYVGLPTHAATEFEIRVRAPRGPLTVNITGSDTLDRPLKLQRDEGGLPPRRVTVQRNETPLRLMSWNVLHGGPFDDAEREDDGRTVLHELDPDVLLLQEVWEVPDLEKRLQQLCGAEWTLHESGGVAVASRFPLTPLNVAAPVETDERRRPKGGDSWSVMRNLFVGVDTPVGPVVLVSAHWKCCGETGSSEDIQRMDDALVLLKAIWRLRDAAVPPRRRRGGDMPYKAPVPARFATAPIMIAGDYNLVGSRVPLDMLLTQDLVELVPLQSDEWTAATWRSPRDERATLNMAPSGEWKPGGFPQGRLDLVVADRRLNVTRTFIADLGQPTLLSDHLPVVVDVAEPTAPRSRQ